MPAELILIRRAFCRLEGFLSAKRQPLSFQPAFPWEEAQSSSARCNFCSAFFSSRET